MELLRFELPLLELAAFERWEVLGLVMSRPEVRPEDRFEVPAAGRVLAPCFERPAWPVDGRPPPVAGRVFPPPALGR